MKIIKGSGLHCMYCGAKMEPTLVPVTDIHPWEDGRCPITGFKKYYVVDVCPKAEHDEEYYKHFRAVSNKIEFLDREEEEQLGIEESFDSGCCDLGSDRYAWCF